jgi:DNA-3-methyladenine glycosylase I
MRCTWPGNPLAVQYHDEEWGVPKHDDQVLFEYLVLDAAQAGLSWDTVLKKRENYRRAFDNFDARRIARYTDKKLEQLMQDPGIIRNRLKVESAVKNARAYLQAQEQFGSFDHYIWQFVDGEPVQNCWKPHDKIPASTPQSDAMSKDMKKRGFTFVGTTICYAFMQAAGLVNDHVVTCFRHREVQRI